jgi:hypothetical protein
MKLFKIDDIVYNKQTKTIGIVRLEDEQGEVKTDADGNVSVLNLELYMPIKRKYKSVKIAPSTEKEINQRGLFNPVSIGLKERDKQIRKQIKQLN